MAVVKNELQNDLASRFPMILRDFGGDPAKTCMAWGIECGDGWHALLSSAMEKIQFVCDASAASGHPVQLVATQVKEKFGTLRFYYSVEGSHPVASRVIEDIISSAESASASVCEETGRRGELCERGGWYRTLSLEIANRDGYRACDEGVREYWSSLTVSG